MNSAFGTIATHRNQDDAHDLRSPVEHKVPLREVVLSSSRETVYYRHALIGIIYSKAERKRLYEPTDNDSEIDRIMDVLYLVSITLAMFSSICVLSQEPSTERSHGKPLQNLGRKIEKMLSLSSRRCV